MQCGWLYIFTRSEQNCDKLILPEGIEYFSNYSSAPRQIPLSAPADIRFYTLLPGPGVEEWLLGKQGPYNFLMHCSSWAYGIFIMKALFTKQAGAVAGTPGGGIIRASPVPLSLVAEGPAGVSRPQMPQDLGSYGASLPACPCLELGLAALDDKEPVASGQGWAWQGTGVLLWVGGAGRPPSPFTCPCSSSPAPFPACC